jgi:signal transduction histidine kinase
VSVRLAAAILALGVLGIALTAVFVSDSTADVLVLALQACGASLLVGLLLALLLWLLRRSSITSQLLIVTIGTVAAVAAGALVSAQTMFAAERPYAAMTLVLVSSGTASVLIGLSLSERVRRESDSLARAARSLGSIRRAAAIEEPATDELARLAHELDSTARRLEESRAYALRLDAARRELVAWVSHDLRTPLARIRAIVEALDDRVVSDTEDVSAFHARLRTETDRLAGLVDELFELSRINAGALKLDLHELGLADLVSDLVASFSPLAAARGIELNAERRGSPTVDGSMEHLERAFSNLLDNAIRYSREGGAVSIAIGARNGDAYVEISDSCGGIPAAELSGLFDAAALRRHAGQANGAGTGLGLAIAKGIIDAHHGSLTAADGNGGCRFTVELPAAGAVAATAGRSG